MEMGGLVQVSLGIFVCGKSSQNSCKPVLIFWSSVCILSVYTLLKVVSYYDLSVLSMSVMGFQKKVWMGEGGWDELYPSLFWIFGICLTLQSQSRRKARYSGAPFTRGPLDFVYPVYPHETPLPVTDSKMPFFRNHKTGKD